MKRKVVYVEEKRCLKISETILFRKFKVVVFEKTLELFSAGFETEFILEFIFGIGIGDFSPQLTPTEVSTLLADAQEEIEISQEKMKWEFILEKMKDDDILHYKAEFLAFDMTCPVYRTYKTVYPEGIETPKISGLEILIRMCREGIDSLIASIRLSLIDVNPKQYL